MINYIFYSSIGLGLSYLLYFLLLKREKTLRFNRFFLLGSLLLCLITPLLEIDLNLSGVVTAKPDLDQLVIRSSQGMEEDIAIQTLEVLETKNAVIPQVLWSIYMVVVSIFLFRFLRNLYHLRSLIVGTKAVGVSGMRIIPMNRVGNPFSFFNFLFIHDKDFENEKYFSSVLAHETAHSQQYHSVDVLLLEILGCFFWFNPFFRLLRKEILNNHEYLADAAVLDAGIGIQEYSLQLIQSGNQTLTNGLSSGFSFIQTKNRLTMIHLSPSRKMIRIVKIFSVLSLFTLVFILSAFSPDNEKPFTVVVDAGHGGMDNGYLNEKEINLQIALALRDLSVEQEVEIILVRDLDVFHTLKARNTFIEEQDADMMLSLHCNAAPKDPDLYGIQAYISEQSEDYDRAYQYSKILLAEQQGVLSDRAEIKTANFLLLRDSSIPSIILHLGFLTNPKEGAQLKDPVFQKKIAENIYAGLLKIRKQA